MTDREPKKQNTERKKEERRQMKDIDKENNKNDLHYFE